MFLGKDAYLKDFRLTVGLSRDRETRKRVASVD
jgi:hypothetical protein